MVDLMKADNKNTVARVTCRVPNVKKAVNIDGIYGAEGAKCKDLFVALFMNVNTNQSRYPLLERALKGKQGIEGAKFVIDYNRKLEMKILGAQVPSRKVADRVVELMKKDNKYTAARIMCRKPNVVRTIEL